MLRPYLAVRKVLRGPDFLSLVVEHGLDVRLGRRNAPSSREPNPKAAKRIAGRVGSDFFSLIEPCLFALETRAPNCVGVVSVVRRREKGVSVLESICMIQVSYFQ